MKTVGILAKYYEYILLFYSKKYEYIQYHWTVLKRVKIVNFKLSYNHNKKLPKKKKKKKPGKAPDA